MANNNNNISININNNNNNVSNNISDGNSTGRVLDSVGLLIKEQFLQFLNEFTIPLDPSAIGSTTNNNNNNSTTDLDSVEIKYYIEQARLMYNKDTITLYVNYSHLQSYSNELCSQIVSEYYRFELYVCQAVQQFIRIHEPKHRRFEANINNYNNNESNTNNDSSFFISFFNLPNISSIRELKTHKLGQLMCISGTVTRTSGVRPELYSGTFQCSICGTIQANILQQFQYTQPKMCISPTCKNSKNWILQTSESIFVDWQSAKIQENSSEIPPGSMPRSCRIIMRNEIVEQTKPGDKCIFTGCLIVVPDIAALHSTRSGVSVKLGRESSNRINQNSFGGITGTKALGVRELSYSLCFLANSVRSIGKSDNDIISEFQLNSLIKGNNDSIIENNNNINEFNVDSQFSVSERELIIEMRDSRNKFDRMVKSIAPNIFGHEDIKQGLLLMLLGGVHKITKDRANLRGDINVCIVGDPSTSKSQFLKYICDFLPRAVYTSGKASSAAGLTASVVRDNETNEFCIEAGALMLADNSVCCIDEFDKMDITDQVAIHEAMEQQTISIAKAGIQATLNARTAVLAAANPIRGRYDKSKTLKQNIDISAPIMSRFDLFFVVLDEQDPNIDANLAEHIVAIHSANTQHIDQQSIINNAFTMKQLQLYIKFAKALKPVISTAARKLLIENYVNLRAADSSGVNRAAYRMTVRQLESMIRLAEARARADLSPIVNIEHVKIAARLLKKSIVRVETGDVALHELDNENDNNDIHNDQDLQQDNQNHIIKDNDDDNDDNNNNNIKNNKQIRYREEDEAYDHQQQEIVSQSNTNTTTNNNNNGMNVQSGSSIALNYNEYERISLLITSYMRNQESYNRPSISQQSIIEWYLNNQQSLGFINDDHDIEIETKKIRLILNRLIRIDHVIQVVSKGEKDPNTKKLNLDQRLLMVHPNFTPEEESITIGNKKQYTAPPAAARNIINSDEITQQSIETEIQQEISQDIRVVDSDIRPIIRQLRSPTKIRQDSQLSTRSTPIPTPSPTTSSTVKGTRKKH